MPYTTENNDEYLGEKGNPVPENHEHSHIYRPDQVWWEK